MGKSNLVVGPFNSSFFIFTWPSWRVGYSESERWIRRDNEASFRIWNTVNHTATTTLVSCIGQIEYITRPYYHLGPDLFEFPTGKKKRGHVSRKELIWRKHDEITGNCVAGHDWTRWWWRSPRRGGRWRPCSARNPSPLLHVYVYPGSDFFHPGSRVKKIPDQRI